MVEIAVKYIASVTGARGVTGVADRLCRGCVIDSRQVERDSIFVAFPGERVDGNDYVLTIFTQNQESNSAARDFIGQLSLDIFQFMNGDLNSTGENLKIDRNF